MEAYLVRHGEAQRGADDSARPLSPRGNVEVASVARQARELQIRPAKLLHSGKLRALQTARILAAELAPSAGVEQWRGISPDDDPAVAARLLAESAEPLMLVGHLPHMGRLVTLLVTGREGPDIVAFHTATLVCLSRDPSGWKVVRVLTPDSQATVPEAP